MVSPRVTEASGNGFRSAIAPERVQETAGRASKPVEPRYGVANSSGVSPQVKLVANRSFPPAKSFRSLAQAFAPADRDPISTA